MHVNILYYTMGRSSDIKCRLAFSTYMVSSMTNCNIAVLKSELHYSHWNYDRNMEASTRMSRYFLSFLFYLNYNISF